MRKIVAAIISALFAISAGAQITVQRQAQPSTQHPAIGQKPPSPSRLLHPMLFVSAQDPSMDWWFRIPSDSGPHLAEMRRAFYGQDFSVFPFAEGMGEKDGKFNLKYEIIVKKPDGNSVKVAEVPNFSGELPDPNMIVACPDIVGAKFDSSYPEGKYIFVMKLTDATSGKTAEDSTYVTLCKWSFPNPLVGESTVAEYIRTYYMQPNPENLYAIFYSKNLNLEQSDAPNKLNYIYVGFLKAAFAKNKFLLPIIRDKFPTMDKLDRIKTIFLLAILDEPRFPKEEISEKEFEYQVKIRQADIPNPYAEWHPIIGAAQIDLLWGEFFADGTYRPIRRIIDLLSLTEEANFADSMAEQKKRPSNPEEKRKFMLGILHKAALMTLAKNSYEIALVRKYCMWAMENKDIPQGAKSEISPIIGEE